MEPIRDPENERDLAGYRLVRRIGTGSRSTVYLGQATDVQGVTQTVALKVFREDADRAAADREVRAMLTTPRPILASLRDVASAPDGRLCLVMDRLPGPSLERLLAERGRILPGEVVTIAATITVALQALHDSGFSHPMIGPDCVWFDGRGRPVLLGLGALVELPTGGAGVAGRRDDLVRLAGWVRSVMEHLDPRSPGAATAESVVTAFEAAATVRPFPADLTRVEAALFAWAPATAVRGAVPDVAAPVLAAAGIAVAGTEVAGTAVAGTAVTGTAETLTITPAGPTGPGVPSHTLTKTARPARPVELPMLTGRDGDQRPGAGWIRAVRGRAAPMSALRRRILGRPALVGVCLAVVLTGGTLVTLSWTDSPAASGESTGLPVPGTSSEAAESPASQGDDAPPGPADSTESLVADDPAAATLTLLQVRERCLAEASVLCLDGVDQAGSVAMSADSHQVRQANGNREHAAGEGPATVPDVPGFTAAVQERRGNAALIVLTPTNAAGHTQPASALVIKGEAGWRLRELFDY